MNEKGGYHPPGQYPPTVQPGYPPAGQYPPGAQPAGQYPPGVQPAGQYPPGAQPAGQYPPPGTGYPAPGYQQGQPPMTTTTIIAQPTTLTTIRFTEYPTQIQCPHCHAQVVTTCDYTDGTAVWLIAVVICLLGYVFFLSFGCTQYAQKLHLVVRVCARVGAVRVIL